MAAKRSDWALRAAYTALAVVVLLSLCAPLLPLPSPVAADLGSIAAPPSASHWFGTDDLGRDVLSRVLYGGRPPIIIGAASVVISLVIGLLLGVVAGYRAGLLDHVLGRIADIQMSIPGIVLALVFLAIYGTNPVNVTAVIAIESWPLYFRVVRAQSLSVKHAAFVEAAKLAGVRGWRVLFRHILPSTYSVLVVALTINFTGAVLSESALSFLGVGIQPPSPDWGVMIAEGQAELSTAWWVALAPGAFLIVLLLAFQTIADTLSSRYSLKDVTLGVIPDAAGRR